MKGAPKTIGTYQDLLNTLALHKAGDISREDVQSAVEQIENRRYIHCPIVAVSDDRKSVTIRYCSEAATGQTVNDTTVSGVAHEHDADGDPTGTIVTLKKPLPAEVTVLLLPATTDPLAALGMSQEQFDDIKEALK